MEKVLHMVGGVGKYSYFANSLLQRKALMKAKPVIKEAVREISCSGIGSRNVINIADVGCSHGPNTLMLISEVLVTIGDVYPKATNTKRPLPDAYFFLNDLPGNDFNSLFRSITSMCSDLYGEDANGSSVPPLYVYGAPGSFFRRILPWNTMHLVHSSYGLHFLSQIPRGLQVGEVSNKRNIYLNNGSPESVVKAYVGQFKKDFSLFLTSRAEELIHGGLMVFTFLGHNTVHPSAAELGRFWQPLSEALSDMVNEGLVEEADLEKFNLPFYTPSLEVKAIVEDEGSFSLEQATSFELDWDPLLQECTTKGVDLDLVASGENVANCTRAVVGPLLLKHFEHINIDDIFESFARKVSVILKGAQKHVHVLFKLKKIQPC